MSQTRIYFRQVILVIVLLTPFLGAAQTTEFTYQGKLADGSLPANANYDFEFRLFATSSGGAAIATQTRFAVPVANGIFTVQLDLGGHFDGANRWLEIAVKPVGSPNPLTVLTPRQPITSTPHSIRSLSSARADVATNSLQLGGVNASQYVLTTDARMTDARNPLPNSASYLQNTLAQQSSSNFNISGNGTAGGTLSANAVNATTQYNIGGSRLLSNGGTANLFSGVGAGAANTAGQSNSFFGFRAGFSNTTGGNNAFFGSSSGAANTSGNQNAFFGDFAGISNTTGSRTSFFGYRAGQQSTTADDNSFFGYRAGFANTTGNNNAFFGDNAGSSNTTGLSNSFFGSGAGSANTTALANAFFGTDAGSANTSGSSNSFFGYRAGLANTGGTGNAFFGSNAGHSNLSSGNSFFGTDAGSSNTLGSSNAYVGNSAGKSNTAGNSNSFFGWSAGFSNTMGGRNSFFGNNTGLHNSTGNGNSLFGRQAGASNTTGIDNSFFGHDAGIGNLTGSNNTIVGANADVGSNNLSFATALGAGAVVSDSNTIVLGRSAGEDDVHVPGAIKVVQLGSAGNTEVCRNGGNFLSNCSSSLRYKTGLQTFVGGLDIVRRLLPITFNWNDGGTRDVGFGAEDVEKVEPLLVTYNDKGEIEGVKYGQLTTVLVNALGEQQTQIEQQQRQIEALKKQAEDQTQLNQSRQKQVDEQNEIIRRQRAEIDAMKTLVCLSHPQAEVCKAN